MSQTLWRIRSKNLSNVFDFAPLYRCQIDVLEVFRIKETWERDKENPRKRKRIEHKREDEYYLYVSGNNGKTICSIRENEHGEILVFLHPKDARKWLKCEPDYVLKDEDEALREIEKICQTYYKSRIGRDYNDFEKSPKEKEKISIRGILEWYEVFKKAGLSVSDIYEAIKVKKDLSDAGLTVECAKKALEVDRYIKKKYNITE